MKQKSLVFAIGLAVVLALTACSDDRSLDSQIAKSYEDYVEHSTSPLTRAVDDPTTVEQFRRTYGVGFSYDGLWGEKCNLKDIRCQVLDLAKLREVGSEVCEELVTPSTDNATKIDHYSSFSRSAYEQSVDFRADVKANLILINGKGEGKVSVWEGGQTNSFYSVSTVTSPALSVKLETPSIQALIEEGRTELLSKNFLECCKWMETHTDPMVVDSFLRRYGSHVVTTATMGGRLDIEMKMELDSVLNVVDTRVLGDLSVLEIVKIKSESESSKKELKLMNSADCRVSIIGGDISLIPSNLLHFSFADRPDLSTYATQWMSSIKYDPDNFEKSNLEMTDMEVTPIWEFIPNKQVAERVKNHVVSSTVDLLREAGYQNGVNTEINLLMNNLEVRLGDKPTSVSVSNAKMANVVCAGRYVASICQERIEEIDANEDVTVVYPIYDRELNLSSGLCIHKGAVYQVRNLRNGFSVSKVGVSKDNKMYLNGGVPSTQHYDNVNYVESHTLPAMEWPNAIRPNGKMGNENLFLVYKSGREFWLTTRQGNEQKGSISGLPNWEYNRHYDRMIRNTDYKYYWNPKEINY